MTRLRWEGRRERLIIIGDAHGLEELGGELNFGVINFSAEPFRLELGARIVHAMFYQIKGDTAPYRGQWQGGRQTTSGRETQV